MIGTIVNTTCILVGSIAGSVLKTGVKPEHQTVLFDALGACTILLGANAFVHNMPLSTIPVLFIVSMAIGALVGYELKLDERFNKLVDRQKTNTNSNSPRLSEGLSTGILLYCIGTFSMLGPVLSALHGDNTYLFTNATLDLISSTILASTYGIGMIWAAPVLFCWQGMFYMIAKFSENAIPEALMCELSIVGGVLITMSGLNILNITKIKTINMLPALLGPVIYFGVKGLL